MLHLNRRAAFEAAERYAKSKNLTIENTFGFGKDGVVVQSSRRTAIKAFYHEEPYQYELEVYEYLRRWNIRNAAEFSIPMLVDSSESLRIIEMTTVTPPYILDFTEAMIDREFERSDEWLEQMEEIFEDDWKRVRIAIWQLEEHGVYLGDVHPRNICCR